MKSPTSSHSIEKEWLITQVKIEEARAKKKEQLFIKTKNFIKKQQTQKIENENRKKEYDVQMSVDRLLIQEKSEKKIEEAEKRRENVQHINLMKIKDKNKLLDDKIKYCIERKKCINRTSREYVNMSHQELQKKLKQLQHKNDCLNKKFDKIRNQRRFSLQNQKELNDEITKRIEEARNSFSEFKIRTKSPIVTSSYKAPICVSHTRRNSIAVIPVSNNFSQRNVNKKRKTWKKEPLILATAILSPITPEVRTFATQEQPISIDEECCILNKTM